MEENQHHHSRNAMIRHWRLPTDRSHCCVSFQKSWSVVFLNRYSSHTSKFLYHLQHGFRPRRSTEPQLLVVYQDLLNTVASGKEIDAIYLDLSKAFDNVPHRLLLAKLSKYGISGSLHLWFQSYLSNRYQRVAMEGVTSDWLPISSGVPQGSILGLDRFCSSFSQTIYLTTFKQDHL